MNNYTLTTAEAASYDSEDDRKIHALMRDLRSRFGEIAGGRTVTTEVTHPDGFVVEHFTSPIEE